MIYRTELLAVSDDATHVERLSEGRLHLESSLERWIENDSSILGERFAIFGRQVRTDYGKYIDLLALDADGVLCIIELKKDRTPRDVVAQSLDYASWCAELDSDDLERIAFDNYNESLASRYRSSFSSSLPAESGAARRIIIVAAELDATSARIAAYLAKYHDVDIKVITFSVFSLEAKTLLSLTSIVDPQLRAEPRQPRAERREVVAWSGYWYVNVGWQPHGYEDGSNRSWDDNRLYGFVSAGRSRKSVREILRLGVGAPIYVWLNTAGYVGFGEVIGDPVPARELVLSDGRRLIDVVLHERSLISYQEDDDGMKEYAVPVRWINAVPREGAVKYKGIFSIPAAVCRLSEPNTLEFLAKELGALPTRSSQASSDI